MKSLFLTFLWLFILVLLYAMPSYQIKSKLKQNKLKHNSENICNLLDLLSNKKTLDSIIEKGSFKYHINELSKKTDKMAYTNCDFADCFYLSLSLKKSLYVVNLLQWMDKYNCPKADSIRKQSKGYNFNQLELNKIKNLVQQADYPKKYQDADYVFIDTMILYHKLK